MSFVFTIAFATTMELMNEVFRPHLDSFVVLFIDDISVYFMAEEDHDQPFELYFIY